MFLVILFSDKLCSTVRLPAGKDSEIHPLFGKTISFLVGVTNAQQGVSVTLYKKPQVNSARYRFSIGTGQSQLYRSDEGGSELSKGSANTPSSLADQWQTTLWIDFRSSNLVLGSGGEILLQWNDPSPISVSYISFTADSNKETFFTLCNRPSESRFILFSSQEPPVCTRIRSLWGHTILLARVN